MHNNLYALRTFNLYKDKYKKTLLETSRQRMLEAYSRVAAPKDKLTQRS